jgi:hypothetical protein
VALATKSSMRIVASRTRLVPRREAWGDSRDQETLSTPWGGHPRRSARWGRVSVDCGGLPRGMRHWPGAFGWNW